LFLLITGYFGWNAVHGARGLEAQSAERAQLAMAQANFASVDARRATWETKITDLADKSIAPDMLDGQARAVLNLAAPADIVVPLQAPAAEK
jgi:cell division protein FtsB